MLREASAAAVQAGKASLAPSRKTLADRPFRIVADGRLRLVECMDSLKCDMQKIVRTLVAAGPFPSGIL